MGGSGRGDPAFCVAGEGSNPSADISFKKISKMSSPCVCKIKYTKTDKKQNFGGGFLSRS